MELVEGQTLRQLLDGGPLTAAQFLPLAQDIVSGLIAAHSKGIIHRDLKTSNVLVSTAGRAKILDFGLAKELLLSESMDSLSSDGQILGTPQAMSPEQAMGQDLDQRSDLFSLGILLYETVTGTSPFSSSGVTETLRQICMNRQIPAREQMPGTSPQLSDLIDRLLEKDPIHRPQSADEVLESLRCIARSLDEETASADLLPEPADLAKTTIGFSEKDAFASELGQPGERRQITVMCCDLVGVPKESDSLDPENLLEAMSDFRTATEEVIDCFEGCIGNLLGHRLLVYFGYPRAHEDDAQRAALAALNLVAQIEQLDARFRREKTCRVGVRIGIHTGRAVVIEHASRPEQLVLGKTLELATTIATGAELNGILVSEASHKLIKRSFTTESLDLISLPGCDQFLGAHRVLATRQTQLQARDQLLPLIGRGSELAFLLDRFKIARTGIGQVVLLTGQAGIGKTRLAHELRSTLEANQVDGPIWLACCGSAYLQNSSFCPVIELLHQTLHFNPEADPLEQLADLEGLAREYELPPEATNLLASLLSLPTADDIPAIQLSPEARRKRTIDAVLRLLLALAEDTPVALVIEDLHWVDPSTLELLGLLIDRIDTVPFFLLLTCRPDFAPPWRSRADLTQLYLDRLVPEHVEILIDQIEIQLRHGDRSAIGQSPGQYVRQQIVEKADGIPLFVEELTKAVLELSLAPKEFQLGLPGRLEVPTTLRDLLTARLDQLGAAKEVAQLAAVVGREFTSHLLTALTSLDERAVERKLQRLMEAGLIQCKGFDSQKKYAFKHALIQDAAYDSVLKRQRQRCHARIARVLRKQFPEVADTRPEFLASHYTEANLFEEAIPYWMQAARKARERSAYVEAIRHLEKGLQILGMLSNLPGSHETELDFHLLLGLSLTHAEGFQSVRVEQAYARANELCRQIKDPRRSIHTLTGLVQFHCARGDLRTSRSLAEQCLSLAHELQESLFPRAHFCLGTTLFHQGELTGALEQSKLGSALCPPNSLDVGIPGLVYESWSLSHLGYPDQSLEKIRQTLTLARECSSPFLLAYALSYSAVIHQLHRESTVTYQQAEELVTLATEQEFPYWLAIGTSLRGWALAARGEIELGHAEIQEGLAWRRAHGVELGDPYYLLLLAEIHKWANRVEVGLAYLNEALEIAHKNGELCHEAELFRLQGQLLLKLSGKKQDEASLSFRQAIDISRRQQAKMLELRAAICQGQLWQQQNRAAKARELLSGIYEWFTEGSDTLDLQCAKALLDDLEDDLKPARFS